MEFYLEWVSLFQNNYPDWFKKVVRIASILIPDCTNEQVVKLSNISRRVTVDLDAYKEAISNEVKRRFDTQDINDAVYLAC